MRCVVEREGGGEMSIRRGRVLARIGYVGNVPQFEFGTQNTPVCTPYSVLRYVQAPRATPH